MTTASSGRPSRAFLATVLIAGAVCLALYAGAYDLPFFSESYTHQARARGWLHWTVCFDLDLVPLRPFQHLLFFALTRCEDPSPALARLPAFAFHLCACLLVFALARRLGAGRRGAFAAGLLFSLAPNVKNLVWVAAISAPGRVLWLLAALVLLLGEGPRRSALRGAAGLLCFLLALSFHQSAVVLPGFLLIWLFCETSGALPARLKVCRARLRDPVLLIACVMAVGYAVYVATLRTQRYNQVKDFAALPANLVKGTLALLPEDLRHLAVEGFRGHLGTPGQLIAIAILGATLLFALRCVIGGRPVTRFAVLAIALDTILPVMMSGYDQRYSYLGSALAACALGCWLGAGPSAGRRPRGALITIAVLAPWWGADTVRDLLEYRQAGGLVEGLLDQAAEEREQAGPGRVVTVVDLPDVWGRERDLPVFNWGFPIAAADRGIREPWQLLRTRQYHTSSEIRRVTPEELERLAAAPRARLLVFDPDLRRFRRRP